MLIFYSASTERLVTIKSNIFCACTNEPPASASFFFFLGMTECNLYSKLSQLAKLSDDLD